MWAAWGEERGVAIKNNVRGINGGGVSGCAQEDLDIHYQHLKGDNAEVITQEDVQLVLKQSVCCVECIGCISAISSYSYVICYSRNVTSCVTQYVPHVYLSLGEWGMTSYPLHSRVPSQMTGRWSVD